MKTPTLSLPPYAYQEQSPHYGRERDPIASFYGDNRDTITVALEHCEAGQFCLSLSRSGLNETCFSKAELEKVLKIAACLYGSIKK